MPRFSVRKPVLPDKPTDRIDALEADWKAERPELDTSGMAIVGRIMILNSQLQSRVTEILRPHALNYSDFDVLATLRRAGAPFELTPTELMNAVVLSSGAMTALLDRLVHRQFIIRGKSKTDGRIRTAILTKKGQSIVDGAVMSRFAEAAHAVSCFNAQEKQVLEDQLRDMSLWLEKTTADSNS